MVSLHFSPNSRWIAAGSSDGAARLIDSGIGTTISDAPTELNKSTALSSDGKLLAAGTPTRAFHVLQFSTGKEILSLELDSPAQVVMFSPDQQNFAVATHQSTAIYEMESGKEICRLNVAGKPNALAFSPDSGWLAVGTSNSTGVFDAASGKSLWLLSRDTKSIAYTPGGNRLAAANEDGNVRVFDPKTGKDVPGAARFSWVADNLAFSPDGRWMANSFRKSQAKAPLD